MSATSGRSDGPLLEEGSCVSSREPLVRGESAPGTFLSGIRLVERLGMSKTPIRAVLERLEAEELSSISPRRGAAVRELTVRELTVRELTVRELTVREMEPGSGSDPVSVYSARRVSSRLWLRKA